MVSLDDVLEMGIFDKIFKHGKGIAAATAIASSVATAHAENSATYSPTSSSSYTQQRFNFEKIPPGLRPELTTEEFVFPVLYEELNGMRNNFDHDQIGLILKGGAVGGFHMKFDSVSDGILPAMRCDGGYAYLNASWAVKRSRYQNVKSPVEYVDLKKLEEQSPSMIPLSGGMKDLMYKDFESAKPKLLRSMLINIYGDVSLAKRRAAEYYSPQITKERKDEIIDEVNNVIFKMKFSQEEYKKCDPKSESTRLMLAQWSVWALTNVYDEINEYDKANKIYNIEKNISKNAPKVRTSKKESYHAYYIVKKGNLKY